MSGTSVKPGSAELAGIGLVKRFGRRTVVDRVDVLVRRGEVVSLLGPNGAGKTTCFAMLAGLIRPDAGRITLEQRDLTQLPLHIRARYGISYLPQEPSVFRGLTVVQNVLLVLEAVGERGRQAERRAGALLEELGLEARAGQRAEGLSGGERRRLEIARALATSPRYMLLDEPFAGIDPLGVVELKGWIRRLAERGIGVLITDHNVRECLAICERAHLLHDGQVLAEGSPAELVAHPQVRARYLGSDFHLT